MISRGVEVPAYTGVGSRRTPESVLRMMRSIARRMARAGYTLWTGDAEGADKAFRLSCDEAGGAIRVFEAKDANEAARRTVDQFHPASHLLTGFRRDLIARDAFQVLGHDLQTPSEFVACWTPDGAIERTSRDTGGTGQAIRIAVARGIPVYNLALQSCREELLERMRAIETPTDRNFR